MEGVVTIPGQIALLQAGLAGVNWAGAVLGLIVDNNPISVTDTLASHTEASFPGYARQPLPLGTIFWDGTPPPGADVSGTTVPTWYGPAGGVGGQMITGWIIVQAGESGSGPGSPGAPMLLAVGQLDAPTFLGNLTNGLPVVANLDLQAQAGVTTQT